MAENLDDDRCEQSIDEVINMSLLIQNINKLIRNFKIQYVLIIWHLLFKCSVSDCEGRSGLIGTRSFLSQSGGLPAS
jgi:hypothetical protein